LILLGAIENLVYCAAILALCGKSDIGIRIFITLGLLTVVATAVGGKTFFKKTGESLEEE
jgi:hypothetical protein